MENIDDKRPAVGVILLNSSGHLVAGLRSGFVDIGRGWQFPQGGRDGDEPVTAALREAGEETGAQPEELKLLAVLPETTEYAWPKGLDREGYRGQRHTWVVFRLVQDRLPDLSRATDKEFDQLRFFGREKFLAEHCQSLRAATYAKVVEMLEAAGL